MKIQIAQILRRLREEKGITQSTLAGVLGVSNQAISRWENGAAYPDIEQLPDIASYFGVSIDTLMGYGAKEVDSLMAELRKLRKQPQSSTQKYRLWLLLEKLIGHKENIFLSEYFALTMQLYKDKVLNDVHVERARSMCHSYLSTLDADDVSAVLPSILYHEEEKNYDVWKRYTHVRSDIRSFHDALLWAHSGCESYGAYLPPDLYDKLEQYIYTLCREHFAYDGTETKPCCNSYPHYHAAEQLLSIFSTKEEDVCLPLWIYVNIYTAWSCFETGREEKGFEHLAALCRQLPLLYRLMEKKTPVCGSTELLADFEKVFEKHDTTILFHTVKNILGNRAFDEVRSDARIKQLCGVLNQLLASIHRFTLAVDPENGVTEEFVSLYERAEKILAGHAYDTSKFVLLVATARGNVWETVAELESMEEMSERLICAMQRAEDTAASAVLCINKVGFANTPPGVLRKKLVLLNSDNQNARFMQGSQYGMYVKKLSELPSPGGNQ